MGVLAIMFALLRFEICGKALSDEVKNSITVEVLPSLYKLSKKQDLAHLIVDALDKNGLLPEDVEQRGAFLRERNMAVYRYEQIQYEYAHICETLEEAKIAYIPLKGSVIRAYYPEPWMRTRCDIDVLVHEAELEEAAEALKEKAEYTCSDKKTINELSLYSAGGVLLELHYDLTEGDVYGKEILSRIWEYTYSQDPEKRCLHMTDEAFYFYHISHMVKHFEYGGCGVRSLLDLWILDNKTVYDLEKRNALLEKGGFLTFANAMRRLSSVWFDEAPMDGLSERLQAYIVSGGTYGTWHNRIQMQQAKKGGKFKYLLSRIFLSQKELRLQYPKLQKYPWLAPFYQVKRWFRVLTKKEVTDRSFKEFSATATVKVSDKEAKEILLKELGL